MTPEQLRYIERRQIEHHSDFLKSHLRQLARIESQQRGQVQHEPQYLDDVPDWTFSKGATEGWE